MIYSLETGLAPSIVEVILFSTVCAYSYIRIRWSASADVYAAGAQFCIYGVNFTEAVLTIPLSACMYIVSLLSLLPQSSVLSLTPCPSLVYGISLLAKWVHRGPVIVHSVETDARPSAYWHATRPAARSSNSAARSRTLSSSASPIRSLRRQGLARPRSVDYRMGDRCPV